MTHAITCILTSISIKVNNTSYDNSSFVSSSYPSYLHLLISLVKPDFDSWQKAMQSEMDSIYQNDTWDLVSLVVVKKLVLCKWVYQYKSIYRSKHLKYKVRLITKGIKRQKGIAYDVILSLILKMLTRRLLLRVVSVQDLELEQMEMKRRLLYEGLQEDI